MFDPRHRCITELQSSCRKLTEAPGVSPGRPGRHGLRFRWWQDVGSQMRKVLGLEVLQLDALDTILVGKVGPFCFKTTVVKQEKWEGLAETNWQQRSYCCAVCRCFLSATRLESCLSRQKTSLPRRKSLINNEEFKSWRQEKHCGVIPWGMAAWHHMNYTSIQLKQLVWSNFSVVFPPKKLRVYLYP